MKRKTLAIPLRCNDWSNTSQIVSLVTPDRGLVDGIAKGAHRPRNSFQGPFDLAELREIVYVEKRPPSLAIIAESEVLEGYRGLRRSWARFVAGSTVLEILRAVSVPGEPTGELFDLAGRCLTALANDPLDRLGAPLIHFEVRALLLLGFLAPIDRCVSCQRRWPGRRCAYFSPRAGGLLCRRCRPPGAEVETVSEEVILALQALAAARTLPERPDLETRLTRRLQALLGRCSTFFLERPFEMLKYSAVWL